MAKNDHILDFQVSMELSHRDASGGDGWVWGCGGSKKLGVKKNGGGKKGGGGGGGGVKQVKQLPNGQKLLDFGFSSVYGIISLRPF